MDAGTPTMDQSRDSEAHNKMDTHEKVCAERYGNIWAKLSSFESQFSIIHERFNTMSNRMWIFVGGVASAAVLMLLGGAGLIIMYLLTKSAK